MIRRKTVGEQVVPLLGKTPETRDPIELAREMQKGYIDNLAECAREFKKNHKGDFFIVVITKREPLLPNVLRNQFFARLTCPTPDYDQCVYHYKADIECAEYVWTIPCRDACMHLRDNATLVDPAERQLLGFVLDFADGTLYKLCKKLNKERADSPLLSTL